MALKIRLSRGGAKKRPFYRIVVARESAPRDGDFLERVGSYNPLLARDHADHLVLVSDRIQHWISVGAKPTDRVARLISRTGLVDAPEQTTQSKQHLPKEKAQERLKEREAAAAAPAPAPAPAPVAEAAPVVEETPVVEEAAPAPAEEAAAPEAPAEETAAEPTE